MVNEISKMVTVLPAHLPNVLGAGRRVFALRSLDLVVMPNDRLSCKLLVRWPIFMNRKVWVLENYNSIFCKDLRISQ